MYSGPEDGCPQPAGEGAPEQHAGEHHEEQPEEEPAGGQEPGEESGAQDPGACTRFHDDTVAEIVLRVLSLLLCSQRLHNLSALLSLS